MTNKNNDTVPKGVAIAVIVVIALIFVGVFVGGFFLFFHESSPNEPIQPRAVAAVLPAAEREDVEEREATVTETEEDQQNIFRQYPLTARDAYVMIMSQFAPSPGSRAEFDFDFIWEEFSYFEDEFMFGMTMDGNLRRITDGDHVKTALYVVVGAFFDDFGDFSTIEFYIETIGDEVVFMHLVDDGYEEELVYVGEEFFNMLSYIHIPEEYWDEFIITEITSGELTTFFIEMDVQILKDLGIMELFELDLFEMGIQLLEYFVTIVLDANGLPIEKHTDMLVDGGDFFPDMYTHTMQHFFFNHLGEGVFIEMPR